MIPLEPGLAWLVGGLVLMLLEVFAPGAFMVWIGLAALGAGLVTLWLELPFSQEVVVFAGCAAVTVGLGLWLRRPRRAAIVNTPGAGLVGRTAHALAFEGREGRVRVGDSDWPARVVAVVNDPAGVPVRTVEVKTPEPLAPLDVVGVDGLVLLVRPKAARI